MSLHYVAGLALRPGLSYAEFTGLHVVNLAKLLWGIFCFRGE